MTTNKSTKPRSSKRKVLLITASLGAGHNSVTRALEEQFAKVDSVQVDIIDLVTMLWWPYRLFYRTMFVLGMTRLPWVYGFVFWMSNRPHRSKRSSIERIKGGVERAVSKRLVDFIRNGKFDVIVNTHFYAAHIIARMISKGIIDSRQVVAVTDVEMHRWWYSENITRWFVPQDRTAEQLGPWGISDDRVTISGMAISPKWDSSPPRSDVLERWNLPSDKKIVLLSGGTEFVCAPVIKIALGLVDHCSDVYVIVLAGRNKKLLANLSKIAKPGSMIRPVGFTDKINELVSVCSLIVTKAGGLTTAECLSQGAPMVLINPVPGQEAGNARFFTAHGAAVIAKGAKEIITSAETLLNNPEKLAKMSQTAKNLYLPGRKTIVQAVLDLLDEQ